MTPRRDRQDHLDELLRGVHRRRPPLELDGRWQARLMGEVGRIARRRRWKDPQEDYTTVFARLLFRFAGAVAVLAAALVLYAHIYGPDLDRHAAGVVFEQPASPVPLERLIWS